MPIVLLWNETVEGALPQFQRWFDSFERSSSLIARWLRKRVKEAEDVERATRRYPVFRFRDGAVTARVAAFQLGALLTQPVEGVGSHLERALGQWNVVDRARAARRETQLLPGLLGALEEITRGVVRSIDRFRRPAAEMFDPARRHFGDVPGIAVMAYRAIATSQEQISRAAAHVRDALLAGGGGGEAPERPGVEEAEGVAGSALPLHFRMDELLRYLVAGLLVVPALARLAPVLGSDLLLHLRHGILGLFEGVESRAFDFRRRILDVFAGAVDTYARQGVVFVLAAREVATSYLRFYARVGVEYLRGVVAGVGTFARQMEDFWSGFVDVVHKVLRYGNAIIGIDVGPVLHNLFELIKDAIDLIRNNIYSLGSRPPRYGPPEAFAVTVEELALNQGGGVRANRELDRAIRRLRDAWLGGDPIAAATTAATIHKTLGYHIPNLIGAAELLRRALATPQTSAGGQPTLTFDPSTVPDVAGEIVVPLREGVGRTVSRVLGRVAAAIGEAAEATVDTFEATAAAFGNAAAAAVRMGSPDLLRRLTSDTDALMEALFGTQELEPSETGFDPLASAYAGWLMQGGFDAIGAALAGFTGMVLDEWAVHLEENRDTPVEVTPTSPRRLLERARLGRVHTPEVRIVARGHELGRPLAGRIADSFQEAVQQAYETGRARLDALGSATPAGAATP